MGGGLLQVWKDVGTLNMMDLDVERVQVWHITATLGAMGRGLLT